MTPEETPEGIASDPLYQSSETDMERAIEAYGKQVARRCAEIVQANIHQGHDEVECGQHMLDEIRREFGLDEEEPRG